MIRLWLNANVRLKSNKAKKVHHKMIQMFCFFSVNLNPFYQVRVRHREVFVMQVN